MVRISQNRIESIFKASQDIDKLLKTSTDVMFAVCPFTIVLGALNTTEAGYKPPNLIVNNYTNFQKVFTGRESILCVWDECYDLSQVRTPIDKGGNETNNYGIVKIKEYADGSNGGLRFYGRLMQSAVTTSFRPNNTNDTMSGMVATKNVNLAFSYESNERLFDEITNNIYKFWMIPELFEFKDVKSHGYLSTDHQWYYLQNCLLIYNARTKKPEILQATFVSVNDVISKSGLAINQYIQVSAPGDRCCLPRVDKKINKIVCDEEYLKYKPITHIQISLFGNVAFSSIVFMGRPANALEQPQTEWKIEAPRFIFPHKYQASSYDELFVNAVPETNYYLLYNAMPTIITGFENWKDTISSTYNAFMSKQYEGFMSVAVEKTKETNQDKNVGDGFHFQYWDPRFLQDKSVWPSKVYNVSGSEYYNINPNKQDLSIKFDYCGENKITPPSAIAETQYSLTVLNISSYFTHKQFYQLPLEVTQTTPVAISSIPVIGGFLNKLLIGLPAGFRLTSNVLTPRIPAVMSLFSVEQFELLSQIFSITAKNNIPFDVFRKDTNSDIYSMCGTTSQTTSFCFNLSNQLVLKPTKIDGTIPDYKSVKSANYNAKTTIDSVKLGQIDKTKMEAYLLGGMIDLDSLQVNNGFVIDSFSFQAIGQVPYRITFYSQTDNPQGNLDNKNAVWTGIYKTLSSASQNTRQWTNFMVLSNPQYSFKDNFYYPQNVENAPIEGVYQKVIHLKVPGYKERRVIIDDKTWQLISNITNVKASRNYDIGFILKIAEFDINTQLFTFEIKDEILGLEHYTPTSAIITLKDFHGKVFTQDIYAWGTGSVNLSKSDNYYIYYVPDDEGYPFWAQDPGANGDKFTLNPIIREQNITLDFSEENEIVIDLSSYTNVLNIDDVSNPFLFDVNTWNYYGEFLKTHLNSEFFVWERGYKGDILTVFKGQSGLDIYFRRIENPKLYINKKRDKINQKWIITIAISYTMSCGGSCMYGGGSIDTSYTNRNTIYNNIKYYYDNKSDINKMFFGIESKVLDPDVSVKYINKKNARKLWNKN